MEGILSTAIGLSGTPKDYTGIQAARQRQQEVGQQRKKLARDKELADLRESIVIKDGLYLDGRHDQIERYQAESIDEMEKLFNAGNFNELNKRKQQYYNVMNGLKQERKEVDEIAKGIQKGDIFTDVDVQRFYNTKDFDKTLSEFQSDPNNPLSPIKVQAYANYDSEKLFNSVAKSLPTDQFTTKEVPLFGGGTKTMLIYTGDPETLARQNGIMFDSNPNIQVGEMILAKQSNPNASKEELREIARNNWIEKGADYLRDKRSLTGKAGDTVINNNPQPIQDNEPLATSRKQFNATNTGIDFDTQQVLVGAYKAAGLPVPPKTQQNYKVDGEAFSLGTTSSTITIGSATKDAYTGQTPEQAGVTSQRYNEVSIIPVYVKPGSRDAGAPVIDVLMNNPKSLKYLVDKGVVEYRAFMTGDKNFTVPFDELKGSLYQSESKGDQINVQRAIKNVEEKVKKYNEDLKSGKSTSTDKPPVDKPPADKRPASDAKTRKMKLDGVDREIPQGAKIVYSKQTGKALGYEFNNQKVKF